MFNNNEAKVRELESLVSKQEKIIKQAVENKRELEKDFASRERILREELHIEVRKAVEVEKENTHKIEKENAVLLTKVEILEKAFENMGFDVKDMKEILNKLVDGLIAKNEIKLVK